MVTKISFIGYLGFLNITSYTYKTDYFAPKYSFVMHTLLEKLSFNCNFDGGFTYLLSPDYYVALGFSFRI